VILQNRLMIHKKNLLLEPSAQSIEKGEITKKGSPPGQQGAKRGTGVRGLAALPKKTITAGLSWDSDSNATRTEPQRLKEGQIVSTASLAIFLSCRARRKRQKVGGETYSPSSSLLPHTQHHLKREVKSSATRGSRNPPHFPALWPHSIGIYYLEY